MEASLWLGDPGEVYCECKEQLPRPVGRAGTATKSYRPRVSEAVQVSKCWEAREKLSALVGWLVRSVGRLVVDPFEGAGWAGLWFSWRFSTRA